MKTIFTKTKILSLALATFLTTAITPAFAWDKDGNGAEITYVGNLNDLPVYRLSVANTNNNALFVTVTDTEGDVVFQEKITGEKIVRNYQFDSELYNDYNLMFTISDAKGKTVSSYKVTKSNKVINEVAVNKIK